MTETQRLLAAWGAWARIDRGLVRYTGTLGPLCSGSLPGRDLSVPYDLTPELDLAEKAIARLYRKSDQWLIKRYYRDQLSYFRLAQLRKCSERKIKQAVRTAENRVGYVIEDLQKILKSNTMNFRYGSNAMSGISYKTPVDACLPPVEGAFLCES